MADTIVELANVETPGQSERLHPHENEEGTTDSDGKPVDYQDLLGMDEEELTEWDLFRLSVEFEPDTPIQVKENGSGEYRVIDGDRRVRALRENGAHEVKANVVEEDLTAAELTARSIRANEQRENNDPERLAWNTAQFVAPWLLPPGERKHEIEEDDVQPIDTYQFARECSVDQSMVSRWMKPIRTNHPIRTALAAKCLNRQPTAVQTEQIDEIVEYLRRGGDKGNRVVPENKEQSVADDLSEFEDVSIREIRDAAERAVEEGMNHRDFIEYVEDAYAPDTSTRSPPTSSTETEEFGEQMDDAPTETQTTPGTASTGTSSTESPRAGPGRLSDQTEEEEESEDLPFDDDGVDQVEWTEIVEDDDLPPAVTVGEVANRKMMGEPISGDAAVAIHIMAQMFDITQGEVVEKFVEPTIVREATNLLGGELE